MKFTKHSYREKLKKGIAILLAGTMLAGLGTGLPDNSINVKAANGKEPSVSAYATRKQLMDNTFAPDSATGKAANIGKLVFGRQGGKALEWYILGEDTGVDGYNTIIFAANALKTDQLFALTTGNQTYLYSAGTGYGDADGSTEVYGNHYGTSRLWATLRDYQRNLFTHAEQNIMNATTVTTQDTKNNVNYTTTGTVYALAADSADSSKIKAGSSDQTVLAISEYCESGDVQFWLRSPDTTNSKASVVSGGSVTSSSVTERKSCQLASNLQLTLVSFASAATAASSDTAVSETIASGTAMTLRLLGESKKIGSVQYNPTTGKIKATKGNTTGSVALVVQGNDGTNDWYYSKRITGTTTVNVSNIAAASNTPASIDLASCKIWIENKDGTVGMIYAVQATKISSIPSVEITGVTNPKANTVLAKFASCATKGVNSTRPQITWTPQASKAGYNTSYTASVTLEAATNYEFADNVTATVNGNAATSVTKNTDGTLTVTYDFPATAKDKLTSITTPQPITVANGTGYDAMNLPAEVPIVTEGNTVRSAPVTWDTTTPESGNYDPAVLTEQTVTLKGTVNCPATIDTNGVTLTTTITITISAAGIVGAPTVNPVAGNYTENQSVTLTSSTEGATIYYTTDGSEPEVSGGIPGGTTKMYTAPIAVTGIEEQSVQTTIKAIAVKNGMQDSGVATFAYTIQIPKPKYMVTVTNGSGAGEYVQGETVTITADAASSGQQFKDWTVESGRITLASSTSATTTFTMPAEVVSVKANYEAIPVTEYTITASDGANGTISPNGAVKVAAGDSKTFTISPNRGYEIDTLKVDGSEVKATTSYTFSKVDADHTIEVTFKQKQSSVNPKVEAPAITSQPQDISVKVGDTATFSISVTGTTPAYQWQIDRNDGKGFVNISGANKASYTTSAVDADCNGFRYQCIVSNPGGSVTSNAAELTVTENNTPAQKPAEYKIIDGANSEWKQNTDGTITIRGNGEFSKFVGVKVDGTPIDAKNYTVKEGSTIITLKADYLNTLAKGTHTIEIVWTDGSAKTGFKISENASSNDDNKNNKNNNQAISPKTGDNSHLFVWITLLIVSIAGVMSMIQVHKKQKDE